MPSRMSPFTMAIDPPSCTCCTVWSRNDVGTPSNVKFMRPNGLPRDRELAAEVVAGRDARQHLDGAHRIVGEQVAQVLDVGAAERLLRRHGFLLLAEALARRP